MGLFRHSKIRVTIFFLLVSVVFASCHPAKTLYFSNRTDQLITFIVPIEKRSSYFNDTISELRLSPREHRVINCGHGAWTEIDKKDLTDLLHKSKMVVSTHTIILNEKFKVVHYGAFVNELVVKIQKAK